MPCLARLLVIAVLLGGCTQLAAELDTAIELYDDAQYEAAQHWLEALQSRVPDMNHTQKARYYYLRGMTAYRLEQRQDALHYLALASVAANTAGAALRPERRVILERTLRSLTPTEAGHHARNPG